MLARFTRYMAHCRSLQSAYRGRLTLFVGMETEAYQGAVDYAIQLRDRFHPDYVVGSVHHVADIPIDMNPPNTQAPYRHAAASRNCMRLILTCSMT